MSQGDGDFVIILSSDLIAKVMADYFNDCMFMMSVKVVDLQATESGYAFTLGFAEGVSEYVDDDDVPNSPGVVLEDVAHNLLGAEYISTRHMSRLKERDEKGRFAKSE